MSALPEVLFLVHRVPFPPNRGDRIRSFHMLEYLSRHARVSLGTLSEEPLVPGTEEELKKRCARVSCERVGKMRWFSGGCSLLRGNSATEGLFASRRLWRTLDRMTRETKFAAVVVFCSSMVQYLDLPGLRHVPAVVDLVDVDSQKFLDYAAQASGVKRWLYQLEATRLRRLESSLPAQVQAITLVSEAEANLYRAFCPNEKTHAMSNGVDLDYFQPRKTPLKEFHSVFVGALDYPPNIDGMLWFCQEVWPGLKQRYPKATLSVVGRQPAPALAKLRELPGVEIVGTVPDVRPYLAEAAAVIAPLRIARGIQNKVLEAMAMGKAVVASPEAMEGLSVQSHEHLLCAAMPQEWIKSIGKLYIEGSTRDRIGQAAWEYVRQHHRWSDCLRPLQQWLAQLATHKGKTT